MSSELTFSEYYEHYLTLHQNKWNRRLHVVGQIATICFVLACFNFKLFRHSGVLKTLFYIFLSKTPCCSVTLTTRYKMLFEKKIICL